VSEEVSQDTEINIANKEHSLPKVHIRKDKFKLVYENRVYKGYTPTKDHKEHRLDHENRPSKEGTLTD
jgi:hypothetical protein